MTDTQQSRRPFVAKLGGLKCFWLLTQNNVADLTIASTPDESPFFRFDVVKQRVLHTAVTTDELRDFEIQVKCSEGAIVKPIATLRREGRIPVVLMLSETTDHVIVVVEHCPQKDIEQRFYRFDAICIESLEL